jgi:ABC-type phosphate transport system substrate-binding protein
MRTLFLIIQGILFALSGQAEELLVIASPMVPDNTITAEQLAEIYSLKKTFWENASPVVAVNREASSAEREKFSVAVFNLSPQALAEYWNRLRFQGKLPPLVQTSNQAVLAFVRTVPGSIGYITAGYMPTGVKVLLRLP